MTTDKEFIANSKKAKSVFGSGVKDKTGAPKTPPLTMNHVTATEDRRNEANLQNFNDVEEMETNEGKEISIFPAYQQRHDIQVTVALGCFIFKSRWTGM